MKKEDLTRKLNSLTKKPAVNELKGMSSREFLPHQCVRQFISVPVDGGETKRMDFMCGKGPETYLSSTKYLQAFGIIMNPTNNGNMTNKLSRWSSFLRLLAPTLAHLVFK